MGKGLALPPSDLTPSMPLAGWCVPVSFHPHLWKETLGRQTWRKRPSMAAGAVHLNMSPVPPQAACLFSYRAGAPSPSLSLLLPGWNRRGICLSCYLPYLMREEEEEGRKMGLGKFFWETCVLPNLTYNLIHSTFGDSWVGHCGY